MNPLFLHWLVGRRPGKQSRRRAGYRPSMDWLEDRVTPTVFKVAAVTSAATPNTYTTLSQAVAIAQSGDTIQIEPGAIPGSATVTQNNLIIQGDPNAGSTGL